MIADCAMALGDRGCVGVCEEGGVGVGVRTMKRRIFAGAVCIQQVYNVPDGVRNLRDYDPEKQKKERFKDAEQYNTFKRDISRRNHAAIVNANCNPETIYSTLTFDTEWEVHTFDEAKKIRTNFVRTLKRKYPDAVIFLYMGRGKSTDRIHFHMLSNGVPVEFISEKWKYGTVKRFSNLREHNWYNGVDHGQDYTGLANYLFDHWTEEVGGHRWFQTKNARRPEKETPTEVRIVGGYSEKRPPKAPKGYKLVDIKTTPYGFFYYKYVIVPPKVTRRKADKKGREDRSD